MSKKSELGRIIERSQKGQKTVLGLPGQGKVSPERAKEILTSEDVATARKVLGEIVGDQKLADAMPIVLVNAGGVEVPPDPEPKDVAASPGQGAATAPPAPVRYKLAKRYAPKTDRNTKTWNTLVAALNESPKTLGELTELVKDHKDFVGYMLRNGHIAVDAVTAQS